MSVPFRRNSDEEPLEPKLASGSRGAEPRNRARLEASNLFRKKPRTFRIVGDDEADPAAGVISL